MFLAVWCIFFGAYSYLKLNPITQYFNLNVAFLVGYWIVCLIYYYIEYYKEKDSFFLVSKCPATYKEISESKDVRFSSSIGLYDGTYVI